MMSKDKFNIAVMKGDGIGPEIVDATFKAYPKANNYLAFHYIDAGLEKFLKHGYLFSEDETKILNSANAFFVGAFTTPLEKPKGFTSYIGYLRKTYDLACNLRPFHSINKISKDKFNVIIFRQNTEDLYFQKQYFRTNDEAIGEKLVTRSATEQITKAAFDYALINKQHKITLVTKSNVLPLVDGFFKDVALNTIRTLSAQYNYPIDISHEYIDAAAYKLIRAPNQFEIILTMNMYGDILSDVLAAMIGSLGLCPSANIGNTKALFEPIHGSAPDIAGKGIANPVGGILALAMLFDWLKLDKPAREIRDITCRILESGELTQDLGGKLSTEEFIQQFQDQGK